MSSNPRVFPDAPPPSKALELLETNLNHPGHRFWKLDIGQITDVYLLGLAIHKSGILASFDSSIATLLEPRSPHLKALEILQP